MNIVNIHYYLQTENSIEGKSGQGERRRGRGTKGRGARITKFLLISILRAIRAASQPVESTRSRNLFLNGVSIVW